MRSLEGGARPTMASRGRIQEHHLPVLVGYQHPVAHAVENGLKQLGLLAESGLGLRERGLLLSQAARGCLPAQHFTAVIGRLEYGDS